MDKSEMGVTTVCLPGPLAGFADTFERGAKVRPRSPSASIGKLRLIADLSRWLAEEAIEVADLSNELIERFVVARRTAGCGPPPSRRELGALLKALGMAGALSVEPSTASGSPMEVLLESFRRYLLDERGLASTSAVAYTHRARRFLAGLTNCDDLAKLTARDVSAAVLRESTGVAPASAQFFVGALRSFLRFCFLEGLTPDDLSAAALSVTVRRRSLLPRGISRSDADALVESCDRRRPIGRRDYAILLVLLRLGLRASEVSALSLDDVDWRAGQVLVHGKGGRIDSLPLPENVGKAIAGYLKWGRPRSEHREVFLTSLEPIAPMGRSGVSRVVRRACGRAGITPIGSHRLRHTLACDLVVAGVPLPEISQVLRHRDIATTAIYARVDLDALRKLAQPWPGGAA
jgi:integrase/recombinase XerD